VAKAAYASLTSSITRFHLGFDGFVGVVGRLDLNIGHGRDVSGHVLDIGSVELLSGNTSPSPSTWPSAAALPGYLRTPNRTTILRNRISRINPEPSRTHREIGGSEPERSEGFVSLVSASAGSFRSITRSLRLMSALISAYVVATDLFEPGAINTARLSASKPEIDRTKIVDLVATSHHGDIESQ